MENNKKIDILEKVFLTMAVIDILLLSIIGLFLVTIITICIFFGIIMIGIETIALFYQAIKTIFTINIFAGMGFGGIGILFAIFEILLVFIFSKLIKAYPKIVRGIKRFIISKEKEIENKKMNTKNNKKKINTIIILLIVASISIMISLLTRNFNTVVDFINTNFNFDTIGEIYLRGIGR